MRTTLQIIPGLAPPAAPVYNSSVLIPPGPDVGMGNAPVSAPPQVDMKFNPANASPAGASIPQSSTLQIIPGLAPPASSIQSSEPLINRLGWPTGNAPVLSKVADVMQGSAQDAQSLLTGYLSNGQSMVNLPHAIASLGSNSLSDFLGPNALTNFMKPSVAQDIPTNNANLGNVISSATGVPNSTSPLNNALVHTGMAIEPAKGLTELGGAVTGGIGNYLNSVPENLQLQKVTDLPPAPVTTPVSPNYLTAVANDTSSQNALNNMAANAQSIIPTIYQKQLLDATGGMGNVGDYLTANRTLAENQASQMMNAYQQYGEEIPTHLQPQVTESNLTPGNPLKGTGVSTPQELIANWDNLTPAQQQIYLANGNVIQGGNTTTSSLDQIKSWLGDDFDIVKSAGGIPFKNFVANPSISNGYDLARMVGESATAAARNGNTANLYGLQSKILNEGVLNPLQELDDVNGTNTAATVQAGRQLFKTNVVPFRSNPTLDSISSGNFPDAQPSDAVKAIVKAQRAGDIPQDHMLSTSLPDFQNLAQYKATPALKNITEGRGNLNPEQLTDQLNTAGDNNVFSPTHPFGQIQQSMNSVNAAKNLSEQNLGDQQALQNAQTQQNALTDQTNQQSYNQNVSNINYNNALKQKQINALGRQKVKRILPWLGKAALTLSGLHGLNNLIDMF